MAHLPQERAIIARQVRRRLGILEGTIYRNARPIDGWEICVTGTGQDVAPPPANGWKPFSIGEDWGGPDITAWFRATVTVPDSFAGHAVAALLTPGAESLCWVNGAPWHGLDHNHGEVELTPEAAGGETFEIIIDANAKEVQAFERAELAIRDQAAWDFYWSVKAAFDIQDALPKGSQTQIGILELVDKVIKKIDLNTIDPIVGIDDVRAFHADIRAATIAFERGMEPYRHSHGMGSMSIMGQSHLDTAWLWPLRVTRKKCGRTFSTALRNMERYPEFTFLMSQAQIYEYVKDHYPELYAQVKERIAEGRWLVEGAAWVEQDLNVPSGEAHVRQYVYGNRFFREEFGIHTRCVWLPDCFGFTFALPQIMKKCGIDYFATGKLWGNQYNPFPHSLFRWRGLDGSEVLSYLLPGGANSHANPGHVIGTWEKYKQKTAAPEVPYAFGYGDGGGGPTIEQLETMKRLENVTGVPRCRYGDLIDTLDRVTETTDVENLPVWHDELFYERHRGCQTTQARTKRNNRKSELLARDTEFLSALAMKQGAEYRADDIYAAWKLILLNQFHDILPGSSIAEVYEDAEKDYAKARATLHTVRREALTTLGNVIDTSGKGEPVVVYNTLGWERDDVAELPLNAPLGEDTGVVGPDGKTVLCQEVATEAGDALLFEAAGLPSMGHAVFHVVEGKRRRRPSGNKAPKASKTKLENDFFVVQLSRKGDITRIYDKANDREVLEDGEKGNQFTMYDDRPFANDAWEIDHNHEDVKIPVDDVVSVEVTEKGPVRATVRVVRSTGKSTIAQDISLWRTIPRIDFSTAVDWYEKRRLLKVSFPVTVTSRKATYEIQYGAIERPTHYSTSYDRAKFEVTGHRWIDLSEADYGVSLLNDCKYGFQVYDNSMRMSVLRSSVLPDPHADEGRHHVTYSLLPHAGDWRGSATVRHAHALNSPLVVARETAHEGRVPTVSGFVATDAAHVVIDCVKKAEDTDDVIVRLYEAHGSRGPVTLTFGSAPAKVTECDMMEENDVEVAHNGAQVSFDIKPWEVRTLRVRR